MSQWRERLEAPSRESVPRSKLSPFQLARDVRFADSWSRGCGLRWGLEVPTSARLESTEMIEGSEPRLAALPAGSSKLGNANSATLGLLPFAAINQAAAEGTGARVHRGRHSHGLRALREEVTNE